MRIDHKIHLPELAVNPPAPEAGERILFARADGTYTIDSEGVVEPMGRPYKTYLFQFMQDGELAPVPVDIENSIGVVTWSRTGTGTYRVSGDGVWSGTVVMMGSGDTPGGYGIGRVSVQGDLAYSFFKVSSDEIEIDVFNRSLDALTDGLNFELIELRVYP